MALSNNKGRVRIASAYRQKTAADNLPRTKIKNRIEISTLFFNVFVDIAAATAYNNLRRYDKIRGYDMNDKIGFGYKESAFASVGRAVNVLNNLIKRDMESCNTNETVTGMQGVILHYIVTRKAEVYSRDIEDEFGMRRATVSGYLALLEQSGMIIRKDVPQDRRLKKIFATDKAREVIGEIGKNIDRNEKKLAGNLTEREVSEFLRIAGIMADNIKK